jgi:hypothetical protein
MTDRWTQDVVSGSARAYRFVIRQPSLPVRLLMVLLVLVAFAVLALIIVPLFVIGALALAVTLLTRRWVGRLRAPNGLLDGRRNVRVVVRD